MATQTLRTATQFLDEAKRLIDQPNFGREAEARFDGLMRLFEASRTREFQLGQLSQRGSRDLIASTLDPAALAFFRGRRVDERLISESGGRLEQVGPQRSNGKMVGAMTVLRDVSAAFALERRTYAGLTTGTAGGDCGNTVPIGFIPSVFSAMKATDQILEAANWDVAATADGRPTDVPSLTDTSNSAVIVNEAGAATFQNPSAFASLQFPSATTWSSQVIKTSIQLDEDAGVKLATLLGDAFRIRFARGFGAQVVSYLISDTPVGASTSSSPNLTELDLLNLLASVDPVYAAAPTAGWVMNWTTLLGIFKSVITTEPGGGSAIYLAKMDAGGHFLLLGKPVFISPSMPNVGAGNVPVLYGDWNRLLIRNVPSEAVVRRYDELYMLNHQLGFEMLFRADPIVMHAGGSGDNPIMALMVPSS